MYPCHLQAITKPKKSFNPMTPTPSSSVSATSSPAVIEDRKRKIRVAIAKLKVTIHELNDEMDAAAENREFLRAAEVKAKIDARSREREELEGVLERSGSDVERMEAVLKEIANSTATQQETATPTDGNDKEKVSEKGSDLSSDEDDEVSNVRLICFNAEIKLHCSTLCY